MQYSKNSKIFIFPLKCVPTHWLDHKEVLVANQKTELIYFIITKPIEGVVEQTIDPVGILIKGKCYKLTLRSSDSDIPALVEANKSLHRLAEDKNLTRGSHRPTASFDSRFSKPKPVASLLKAVKSCADDTPERKPNGKQYDRDIETNRGFIGKRAVMHFQSSFIDDTSHEKVLASEYMSSAKQLKEAVHTSYDKILNDVTL